MALWVHQRELVGVHSFIPFLSGKLSVQPWESFSIFSFLFLIYLFFCRNIPFLSTKWLGKRFAQTVFLTAAVKLDWHESSWGLLVFRRSARGSTSGFDSVAARLCDLHQWDAWLYVGGAMSEHFTRYLSLCLSWPMSSNPEWRSPCFLLML